MITNRVRYRGITAGKSNHPRGIRATTNSIPAVLPPQSLPVSPRCSRGYRDVPAIPITVQQGA